MGTLRKLKLPLGSEAERFVLTQQQVDTLVQVYYDADIADKQVSGYVYKNNLTRRENYLLTQVGLDVSCETVTEDEWSLSASSVLLHDGQSATISINGPLVIGEVSMEINSVTVDYGNVTEEAATACFTLVGNQLTFDKGNLSDDFLAKAIVSVYSAWAPEEVKQIEIAAVSVADIRTVFINPVGASASLEHRGSLALVEDYVSKCKCYVFNPAGTLKAEIASATFEGNYSGMTSGTVTFKDGTTTSIGTLNNAGCNFMVLRPELHIFSGLNEFSKEILQCTGVYHIKDGKVFPKKYIGMFKAYNQNGVLKSQPNRIPANTLTIAAFQNLAKAGSVNYGLWNYSDWCRENALHLSYFANTNYENNVGIGRINNFDQVKNIVTGFTLPLAVQHSCGQVATLDSQGLTVNCLNFFGLEGLCEQYWEFVIGFRHDGNIAYIWDENNWSESHIADRSLNLSVKSANQSYITSIIAGEHFDVMPKAVGAGSTTGMCDGHWIANTGRMLFVGGNADNGSICGLSCSAAHHAFSRSLASVGARLAFYGEPEEIRGSEFVAPL